MVRKQIAVSRQEAARLSGLSVPSIDRAIRLGRLHRRKLGWRTVILMADLERFVLALPDPEALTDPHTPEATDKNRKTGT